MARWKARVEFLLSVIELFFLSLAVEALQDKMCQDSLLSEGGRSVRAKISGEGVVPGNIFGFYKTRHILLSDSANCTVLRAVVLIQYRRGRTDRWTDRQTDGIAVASTALLAMRALRRAVKTAPRVQTSLNFMYALNCGRGSAPLMTVQYAGYYYLRFCGRRHVCP